MVQGKKIESVTIEELFTSCTDGSIPVLIDVKHDALTWEDEQYEQEDGHLRLINSPTSVRYEGHKYLPSFFSFTIPQEDGQKVGKTSVVISAIDQRVVQLIRSIKTKPRMTIVALFAKPTETSFAFSKVFHYEFEASNASWDDSTAKWDLVFDPITQMNVPKDLGTKTRCPGIIKESVTS